MNEMWSDAGVLPAIVLEHRGQRQPTERHRDHGLTDHLGLAAQAEVALLVDLDEVVEEPDEAHADEQEEQQQRAGGGRVLAEQLGREVADHRGGDDDDPTHRGCAPLGVVAGRAVVADLLPVALARQHADREVGAEQRDDQGQSATQQDRFHGFSSTNTAASLSSSTPREALTTTTSPGAMFSRNHARASARSAANTPVVDDPVVLAAPSSRLPTGFPDGEQHVDAAAGHVRPDLGVPLDRLGTELTHLAEYGDGAGAAPRPDRGQRVDRRVHRRRVGVVGVVEYDDPVGALVQLHPPSRLADGLAQRVHDLAELQPRPEGERGRRGSVVQLVFADLAQGGGDGLAGVAERRRRPVEVVVRRLGPADVAGLSEADDRGVGS